MPNDLRTYLELLKREKSEIILRIIKPRKAGNEITALQRKLDALKKYPVIIVERPILDNGQESLSSY